MADSNTLFLLVSYTVFVSVLQNILFTEAPILILKYVYFCIVFAKQRMTVAQIADAYHTSPTTVQTVRASYVNNGLESTIYRKKRETPPVPAKVTGDVEAHIVALACSEPPEGYERWTVRLLADKCVELNYVDSLSHMTVSRVLKKTNLSLT